MPSAAAVSATVGALRSESAVKRSNSSAAARVLKLQKLVANPIRGIDDSSPERCGLVMNAALAEQAASGKLRSRRIRRGCLEHRAGSDLTHRARNLARP